MPGMRRLAFPAFLVLLVAYGFAASAAGAADADFDPRRPLQVFLARETTGLPGRVEVSVEALDDRMKLAPCEEAQPFVPAGARLWGRTRLGVRCVKGASWSVLLPAEVRVFAPALVAARPIAANEPVTAADVRAEEIEISREPAGVLTDPAQLGDSIASRPLAAGQTVRRDALRARPVLAAGENVKVVYAGRGFAVSVSGRALAPAAEGQPVRVQIDGGRVLTGTARKDRVVQVGG